MGRPDPMPADHQSDPHQEEHDLYEHPLESDTTYGDIAAGEHPKGQANYHDPSTGTNNMINQQQQFQSTTPFPPARNPVATSQLYPPPQQSQGNVNIPGGLYPPQAQHQPQMYPPPAGIYPPPPPQVYQHQQQYQQPVQFPLANPLPQVYQHQQQYQQPVQFPPTNPLPQVYQQPISAAPIIVQHQFNETITEGIPIQQQQQTYPSRTPTVGLSHTPSAKTPTVVSSHNGWTTGLFDCMDDPLNAIITVFFPCLTFGQIAEMIDNGGTSCGASAIVYFLVGYFTGLPCLVSCTYRSKLRNQFNLDETPVPDCVAHFLCECCALCQAYRELSNRGFDPAFSRMGRKSKEDEKEEATGTRDGGSKESIYDAMKEDEDVFIRLLFTRCVFYKCKCCFLIFFTFSVLFEYLFFSHLSGSLHLQIRF